MFAIPIHVFNKCYKTEFQRTCYDILYSCIQGEAKVSVFEKSVILDYPIFLSVEVLKLRQGQLHFLKWNHVFFFSITLLPILRRIQRPTTQGHSSHAKDENETSERETSTNC